MKRVIKNGNEETEGELALLQITLLEWISKIDVARLHADHDVLQLERGQVIPTAVRG